MVVAEERPVALDLNLAIRDLVFSDDDHPVLELSVSAQAPVPSCSDVEISLVSTLEDVAGLLCLSPQLPVL